MPHLLKALPLQWRTDAGEECIAQAWVRDSCRGVLVCVHGMSGAGEQFEPLAEKMDSFSVYALELRGQGSDHMISRRGAILDLPQQHRDLEVFLTAVRAIHPEVPIFLVGESMGALLSASYVASHPKADIQGLVLSVPVVALRRPVPAFIRETLRWLAVVFPNLRLHPRLFLSSKAEVFPLTRYEAYQHSLQKQPYNLRIFSLRFLTDLGDLIACSNTIARALQKPCLVLAAGQDCFVRVEQIQTWFDGIASNDKSMRVYLKAYHLLWHDWDRDEVLADISAWLGQHL